MIKSISSLADSIIAAKQNISENRSFLVGVSGIDASGKGYIAKRLAEGLEARPLIVANINIDGWLNLPHIRFDPENPAGCFYKYAIRFEEMFAQLVLPLRANREIHLIADFAEETAAKFRKHEYAFSNIDIILLEGIFLFKKAFQGHFDLKVWIDCPFEKALKRAISRSQEGLSEKETIRAYETIYFPAQRKHFLIDDPKASADIIFANP